MTESINLNTNGLFNLQNDVRITSNNIFNAQDAFENSFEDILLEEVSKEQQENQKTINEIKQDCGLLGSGNFCAAYLQKNGFKLNY